MKISKWHHSETRFCSKRWHWFGPENALAAFSKWVSDTRPKNLNIQRLRSVYVFLMLRKPEIPVGPTFSVIKKTEGESGGSDFLE